MCKWLKKLSGVGLYVGAGGLFILAVSQLSGREVWQALQNLSLWEIIVLALLNGVVLLALFGRLAIILAAQGYPLPLKQVAQVGLAGFAISYLTPGPQFGGEPAQVYLLHRHHQVPLATAAAGVTLDKLLTVITSFVALLGGIWFTLHQQYLGSALSVSSTSLSSLTLLTPFGLLGLWWQGYHPISWLGRVVSTPAVLAQAEQEITHFCQHHRLAFAQAVTFSLLGWLALAVEYGCMASFLGLQMSLGQMIALLTAVRLAFLLPLPGAIGTLEASQIWALELMGLNPAVGLSLSLLIRARDLLLAFIGLWWSGFNLRWFH